MFAYMIFPPKVPMVHGATPATVSAATTSATSVPFAATATANQVKKRSSNFTVLIFNSEVLKRAECDSGHLLNDLVAQPSLQLAADVALTSNPTTFICRKDNVLGFTIM
ncbi:hypothetical protein U0070_002577 [Myodes glareolus]|uniref:Uncharacterized protein n=1 Tax=Myodes glareolus TaxID=447135 RepID=A0AAW0I6U4_MYOGA